MVENWNIGELMSNLHWLTNANIGKEDIGSRRKARKGKPRMWIEIFIPTLTNKMKL
jgi:hypothetical protein